MIIRYFSLLLTFLFMTSVLADDSDYWFMEPLPKKKKPKKAVASAPVKPWINKTLISNSNKKSNRNYGRRPIKKKNNKNINKDKNKVVQLKDVKPTVRYKKINARRSGPNASSIGATYSKLGINSIWTNGSGGLNANGKSFMSYIKTVDAHGLIPHEYYLSKVNSALTSGEDVDKLISRAFVKLAKHAALGRLIPKKADPDWHISQTGISQENILKNASNGNVGSYIDSLFPQTSAYKNLVRALLGFKNSGGWSQFPTAGPRLQQGSHHPHVSLLRKRLRDSGYSQGLGIGNSFGAGLSGALIRFQSDHGLNADGVLGRITRLTLAKSSSARSMQIVTTLERLRWLPSNLGGRYIVVNTAGYQLNLIENERTSLNMRTVVGKKRRGDTNHETPSFTRNMRYVILNPRWYVPPSIASEELLLLAQKDKNYFKKKGYKVYDSKGEVKSNKVNWKKYTKGEKLPLQIVQNAGARNALGKIKFMLPNKYNIYLHDTPQKSLFARDRRAFSHGCVRLAKPIDLATKLLGKSAAEVSKLISTGRNRRINLDQNIPVYIVYLTAWTRDDGSVIFFDDYFDRDKRMQHNFS